MADIKRLIHDQVVRPALESIPPMALARVVEGASLLNSNRVRVAVRSLRPGYGQHEEGDPLPMERLQWREMDAVPSPVFRNKGLVPQSLAPGDAVWIQFLGHDRSLPVIVGLAGDWAETLKTYQEQQLMGAPSYTQIPESGSNIPALATSREGGGLLG